MNVKNNKIEKIKEQAEQFKKANLGKEINLIYAGLEKIMNQKLLLQIFLDLPEHDWDDWDYDTLGDFFESKITDQTSIKKIVLEHQVDVARLNASEKLINKSIIVKAILDSDDDYFQILALNFLNTDELRVKIAKSKINKKVRIAAMERIDLHLDDYGAPNEIFNKLGLNVKEDIDIRKLAINSMIDFKKLKKIINSEDFGSILEAACDRISFRISYARWIL